VEKPDAVKSIREQDIVEDDHHNVETTKDPSQEDDDEEEFDDDGPDLFTNRFAEKQEEIDGEKIDLSMEGTTVAAVEFVTTAIATSKKVVKEVTNVLTPGFIKRYYNKKIYTKAIGDIEASVEKIKNKAEKVQKKELKNYQKVSILKIF